MTVASAPSATAHTATFTADPPARTVTWAPCPAPRAVTSSITSPTARNRTGGRRLGGELVDLRTEVAEIRLGVDPARADDALEGFLRRELAAVAMQALAEPIAQRGHVAALELRVDVAEVGARALP